MSIETRNIEYKIYNPEFESRLEDGKKEISEIIESLMHSPEKMIGQGATAEVYRDLEQQNTCYKVIKEVYDRFVNPPKKELALQFEAEQADTETCRVPRAHGHFKIGVPELQDDKDYLGIVNVLAMERLHAVNLLGIIRGQHRIPENFDPHLICDALEEFVHNLHNIAKIHHRDLGPHNIMIDTETGEPYVIDFGSSVSTAGWGNNEDPYFQPSPMRPVPFPNDMQQIKALRAKLISLTNH